MSSLQQYSLNFNKSLSYNFQGGNLSSDSGLLIIRSFVEKLEIKPLLEDVFEDYSYKKHSFSSIAEQLIYTTIAGYRHDDDSDSLRNDPVFTNVLGKSSLASQPTISRFINSLDDKAIALLNKLLQSIFEKGNDINSTNNIVLDIDSTNFETHVNKKVVATIIIMENGLSTLFFSMMAMPFFAMLHAKISITHSSF